MKSISMIKEEFKNLTPEQITAQIALYQEDERKGVQNFFFLSKTTAPATTGPANGPRPTSSIPQIKSY